MIEFHDKDVSDDDDDFDDNLDWLIEASEENNQENSESNSADEKSNFKMGNYQKDDYSDQDYTTTDEETDDDDEILTEEEKKLLRHNTLLNDASDGDNYDVKLRLEKANQELAADQGPLEGERERKVGFKAELIEKPPLADSSLSSISQSDDDEYENDINEKVNEMKLQNDDDDVIQEAPIQAELSFETESMVVEKGGKFEYVQADEMTGDLSMDESPKTFSSKEAAGDKLTPIKVRPKSAPTRSVRRNLPKRPMSAATSDYTRPKSLAKTFTYTEEQKRRIKEKADTKAKQEEEEKKRKQEEERLAREEADEVWKDWVERKNIELRDKKKEEEESARRKEELSRRDPDEADEAFQAWLKHKSEQARKDRILLHQQQMEMDEGCYVRERKECDHAFRSWLRQKNELARKRREEDARIRRTAARQMKRSRKAQKVMDSLREAQRLKYVDYYGYRL